MNETTWGERMDYAERRSALLEKFDADAFMVFNLEGTDRVSLYYLTGFTGEGVLFVSRNKTLLLTDSRYTEQAGREVPGLELVQATGSFSNAIASTCKENGFNRLAFSGERVTYALAEKIRSGGLEPVALTDPISELRLIKDKGEIGRIRDAVLLTEKSLNQLMREIKPGMSERELALRLEFIMRENGAQQTAFDLIVAAGENCSLPHYQPGDRVLRAGDLLLFDIGAKCDWYCADMTRVFSVGKASPEAEKIYETVLAANKAGIAAVQAGASGKAVDAAARDLIAASGHKEHFGHGLGHGVGLEVHEGPHLSPMSKDTLRSGMTVTVEPGIYLPGFGGVRIEDLVVVTDSGCDVLTTFPKERLIEVG